MMSCSHAPFLHRWIILRRSVSNKPFPYDVQHHPCTRTRSGIPTLLLLLSSYSSSSTTTPTRTAAAPASKQYPRRSLQDGKKESHTTIAAATTSVSIPYYTSAQMEEEDAPAVRRFNHTDDGQRYYVGCHQWTRGRMRHPRHKRIGQDAWTFALQMNPEKRNVKKNKNEHNNNTTNRTSSTTTRDRWLTSTPLQRVQQSFKQKENHQWDNNDDDDDEYSAASEPNHHGDPSKKETSNPTRTSVSMTTTTTTTTTVSTIPKQKKMMMIWVEGLDRSVTSQTIVEYFQTNHDIPIATLRFQSSTAALLTLVHSSTDISKKVLQLKNHHRCWLQSSSLSSSLGKHWDVCEYSNTRDASDGAIVPFQRPSSSSSSPPPDSIMTVHLGNIPPDTNWHALRDFLQRVVGAVKSVHIVDGDTTATATFWNSIQVQYAIDTIPHTPFPDNNEQQQGRTHGFLTVTREGMYSCRD